MRRLVNDWIRESGVGEADPTADMINAIQLQSELLLQQEGFYELSPDEIAERKLKLDELRPASTYYTYLNAIHLKGEGSERLFVPSFRRHRRFEAEVRDAYQRAYPTAEIVFIPADTLIEQFGALHCISCVIPNLQSASATQ
jgi:agmatine/peptidylarginine deiminase